MHAVHARCPARMHAVHARCPARMHAVHARFCNARSVHAQCMLSVPLRAHATAFFLCPSAIAPGTQLRPIRRRHVETVKLTNRWGTDDDGILVSSGNNESNESRG
jgi:hypothetical protein